ncbi:unnamed protein product [Effrenium voratum]|uniref:Uncharacterized protein n=1 Tax=Effrenium voratum TaxID=2562239 RepID=A0AA36IQM6_9DINO|nr:unnamed protein product [Effrenium voratum]
MLLPSSFLELIDKGNHWEMISGQPTLARAEASFELFWKQYEVLFPNFSFFETARRNSIPFKRVCPVYIHGDEGTHFKKSGIMILQWQGVLGAGTSRSVNANTTDAQAVNSLGNTLRTRLLVGVMPRAMYSTNGDVLEALFEYLVEDFHKLSTRGSAYPPFMETIDEEPPWDREPCFTRVLPRDVASPSSYFKPDVWHTVNLGVGRSWVASCVVCLTRNLDELSGLTPEHALQQISASYISFCENSAPRKVKYISSITRATLGWESKIGGTPDGRWSKGSLTTTLASWLEYFCREKNLEGGTDERLSLVASGTRALNAMMKGFYDHDLWLDTPSRNVILSAGNHYLQASSKLALLSYNLQENLFPITPKHHMMFHVLKNIQWQGDVAGLAFNPVSEFCALDEDYVGRLALIARSCSPRKTCVRTIERYLLLCRAAWVNDLQLFCRKRGRNGA